MKNEKPATHPMQPLYVDDKGVVRFQPNKIVEWLFESGKLDLKEIALASKTEGFSAADQMQIAQMLGYSVDGFCDLSYVTDEAAEAALDAAEPLRAPPAPRKDDAPSP